MFLRPLYQGVCLLVTIGFFTVPLPLPIHTSSAALATEAGNSSDGGIGRDPRFHQTLDQKRKARTRSKVRKRRPRKLTATQQIDIKIRKLRAFIKRERAYANTIDQDFKNRRDEAGLDASLEKIANQKATVEEQIELFEAYEKELEHNAGVYEDLKKEIQDLSTSPYDNLKTKGGIRTTTFTISRLRGGSGVFGIIAGAISDVLEKGIKSGLKRSALNKVRDLQAPIRDKLTIVYKTLKALYTDRNELNDREREYKRYRSLRDSANVNAFRAGVAIEDLKRKKKRIKKAAADRKRNAKRKKPVKRRSNRQRRRRSGVTRVTP